MAWYLYWRYTLLPSGEIVSESSQSVWRRVLFASLRWPCPRLEQVAEETGADERLAIRGEGHAVDRPFVVEHAADLAGAGSRSLMALLVLPKRRLPALAVGRKGIDSERAIIADGASSLPAAKSQKAMWRVGRAGVGVAAANSQGLAVRGNSHRPDYLPAGCPKRLDCC